jgi:putative heme degradation protein
VDLINKGHSINAAQKQTGCSAIKLKLILEATGEMVAVEGFTMRVHKQRAQQYEKARQVLMKTGVITRAARLSGLTVNIVWRYAIRLGLDCRQMGIEKRREKILAMRRENPNIKRREIAARLGISTSTVSKYWNPKP